MNQLKLFFRKSGSGPPLIILHGLLGSSDNWLTQAKILDKHYTVYLVDLRNHGNSPHSDDFDYDVMADDLLAFFKEQHIDQAVVIGHSMGGKVAMRFALAHPERIRALIVVDIAPKNYDVQHDALVASLMALDPASLKSRNEADEQLGRSVPDAAVRQFLLKNLARNDEGGYRWKANLPVINKNLEKLSRDVGEEERSFAGPVLFIKGARSPYIKEADSAHILRRFPSASEVTLDTGHWVQAERPEGFSGAVLEFLEPIA